ncbi:MAG: GerMN domain-containing protein [Lachnospiraceae bacterium]|nr:GerMN domain-containing protein [Lachnospiraceae bacterium]
MRKGRRIISLILVSLMAFMMLFLGACRNGSSGKAYLVYYSNADADDIIYREYVDTSTTKDMYSLVVDLLYQMFDAEIDDNSYYSAKPENVKVNDFVVNSDGILSMDFSREYLDMTNVQEIILRASVVLTVIQVNGINGVVFTVEGEQIADTNGKVIGVMTADSFVNVLLTEEGMLKQETDLTLYFADETGTALVPATYHFAISKNNSSMEEYIVRQIIEGPSDPTMLRTLSKDLELISIVTTDYVCYVNFDSRFLEQPQVVSDELMIYSVVNSLCRLPYVSSVQFMVDGASDIMLHSVMDLSKPLSHNINLEKKD